MDLETENRIASILLKEAAELRRQADKEGVNVYLRKPTVRSRPNSRFLTATVRGVQQANRVVEVNEMWRVRQKELELDDRLKGRPKDESSKRRSQRDISDYSRNTSKKHLHSETNASASCSSSEKVFQDPAREEEGLKDEEMEEFLHSRVKRGRGAVGSRMDETGPYLPPSSDSKGKLLATPGLGAVEKWGNCIVLGPEKPPSLETRESSEEESPIDRQKKKRKLGSSKHHSKKHKSKEKSKDKKKKRREEEKRSRHY